jgi:hypothetical protein
MTTPSDSKSSREPRPGAPQEPSSEVGHERPLDDPGRGHGDVLDDKIPVESPSPGSSDLRPSGSRHQEGTRPT